VWNEKHQRPAKMNKYNQYKKCIFTIITGQYDTIIEPSIKETTGGWDFICLTDNESILSDTWDVRPIHPRELEVRCPKRRANAVLMNYAEYISDEYDICIYIDGNIEIKETLDQFLECFNYDPTHDDMMISNHPIRNCIYEEATAVINLKKDDRKLVLQHSKILVDQGYPRNNGLYETGMIVINRNSEKTKELFQQWHKYYMSLPSKRDQLSLNYSIWKSDSGITIKSHSAPRGMSGKDIRAFNKYLEVIPHVKDKQVIKTVKDKQVTKTVKDFIIFENTPFRIDKNLIIAYNSFMELLPDEGWALFRDSDTLFLDSFYGEVFERAIRNNPDTGCFTCLTNRIGNKKQLHNEYSGDDIAIHRTISDKLKKHNYNTYEQLSFRPEKSEALSGMVILLSKKAWKEIGGFKKSTLSNHSPRDKNLNILGVDNQLHKDLNNKRIPLTLIKEMYLYHWYRGGDSQNNDHLKVGIVYNPPTPTTHKNQTPIKEFLRIRPRR